MAVIKAKCIDASMRWNPGIIKAGDMECPEEQGKRNNDFRGRWFYGDL